MLNKNGLLKISTGILMLIICAVPQLSFADWSVGVSVGNPGYHRDDHHFYRWHDHPRYGLHIHYLPHGYLNIWTGGNRYYYFDGLYYTYVGGGYVLVNPPLGAYVQVIPSDFQPVIINGRTYYTDNGVYYILTKHHGYKVVAQPLVYSVPAAAVAIQNAFPINIPNNSGGYVTIVIKRSGNGFMGPQGEFYPQFPRIDQLRVMYSK